jgi:signal transduction histidine kinase
MPGIGYSALCMERAELNPFSRGRVRVVLVLVLAVTMAVFGAILFLAGNHLRDQIREQLAGRDGEALYAVALMQQLAEEEEEFAFELTGEPAELFNIILQTSRLKGVLAARLFAPDGSFWGAFPETVEEAALAADDLKILEELRPLSRFHSSMPLRDLFLTAEMSGGSEPLLEVLVPLHPMGGETLLGAAQFIMAGHSLAAEFEALDRRLFLQGGIAFLIGTSIVAAAMLWALGRLNRAHRLLSERTASLLRANHELTLAAKSSAVGAVTSHLLHGLKNPLSGLQTFLENRKEEFSQASAADWDDLVATTRRMQNLVNETVRVLQENAQLNEYEISLAELVDLLGAKTKEVAARGDVGFTARSEAEKSLANREANLVLLILENLLQNAIQATPPGKSVSLLLYEEGDRVLCDVADQGRGVDEAVQNHLFAPCRSSKPGGSGLGLAISRQLAAHLGAELFLKSNSAHGCIFTLSLPQTLFLRPAPAVRSVAPAPLP